MKYEGEEIYFEEAFRKLEKIARELENEKNGLEESLKLYKKGVELCKICEKELQNTKLQIKYFDSKGDLEE